MMLFHVPRKLVSWTTQLGKWENILASYMGQEEKIFLHRMSIERRKPCLHRIRAKNPIHHPSWLPCPYPSWLPCLHDTNFRGTWKNIICRAHFSLHESILKVCLRQLLTEIYAKRTEKYRTTSRNMKNIICRAHFPLHKCSKCAWDDFLAEIYAETYREIPKNAEKLRGT